jgi:hypothetical protein
MAASTAGKSGLPPPGNVPGVHLQQVVVSNDVVIERIGDLLQCFTHPSPLFFRLQVSARRRLACGRFENRGRVGGREHAIEPEELARRRSLLRAAVANGVEAEPRDDTRQPGAEHRQGLPFVFGAGELIELLPGAQSGFLNEVGEVRVRAGARGVIPRQLFEPGADEREQFVDGRAVSGTGGTNALLDPPGPLYTAWGRPGGGTMATHVIQFRDKEQYGEAIMVLLNVPVTRSGIPGLKMIVSDEHIQALLRAKVDFVDITKRVPNGSTPVQPRCLSLNSESWPQPSESSARNCTKG